jgi:hypothetical protein
MRIARLLILGAFLLSVSLSASGWFEQFSVDALFAFGTFAIASGYLILHRLSQRFRLFVQARNLKRLTQSQAFRFFGTLALVKAYQHTLPLAFAVPTGIADLIIAIGSFFIARIVPDRGRVPKAFFVWHFAGLATLAMSAVLAILTSSPRFGLVDAGLTSQAMTSFPVSIVPTFIGPMVTIFHLLALDAARHRNRHYGVSGRM